MAAEGIVRALRRQTAILAEHQIPVTASIGIALFESGPQPVCALSTADGCVDPIVVAAGGG